MAAFSVVLLFTCCFSCVICYTNLGQLSDDLHEMLNSEKYRTPWLAHWEKWRLAQENATQNVSIFGAPPLICPEADIKSSATPTSVHTLRPADIKIVAAMGDSLTAANGAGAQNLLEVLLEYRGLAFDVGGDGDLQYMVTLPNILREFNSDLVGASRRISPVWFKRLSQLNVAVPGAVGADMPDQARELLRRIRDRSDINLENDWKLVTVFVGANDLCGYCKNNRNRRERVGMAFGRGVKRALDILKENLPRTFVSLVNVVHVEELTKTHRTNLFCFLYHTQECPCILPQRRARGFFGPLRPVPDMHEVVRAYQRELESLVQSGLYDSKDDFTVVLQPLLQDTQIPMLDQGSKEVDLSFFAPDCFHWSQLGHSSIARGLWNGMLDPVGNKTTAYDVTSAPDLRCPNSDCPFIRTGKNSRNCSIYTGSTVGPQGDTSPGRPVETTPAHPQQETTTAGKQPATVNPRFTTPARNSSSNSEDDTKILLRAAQANNLELAARNQEMVSGEDGGSSHITSSVAVGSVLGLLMVVLIISVIFQHRSVNRRRQIVAEPTKKAEKQRKVSEKTPLLDEEMTKIY